MNPREPEIKGGNKYLLENTHKQQGSEPPWYSALRAMGVVVRSPTTTQDRERTVPLLLKAITTQTEDHALKSSTTKSYWLNEFPQHFSVLSKLKGLNLGQILSIVQ